MRTIKFRGKRIDNGEWIYSYSINYNFINVTNKIIKTSVYLGDGANGLRLIDSKTVGQYTGLKDKNVWECDIIGEPRVNKDAEVVGIVKYDDDLTAFIIEKTNGGWEYLHKHFEENKTHEVIGNISENPELLKSKDNRRWDDKAIDEGKIRN